MVLAVIFIITLCADIIIPFVLAKFYSGYSHKTMALSVLGCRQSPVKWVYNLWCIFSGLCIAVCSTLIAAYNANGLTIAIAVLLAVYGFGCEVISGFFPLNEKREDIDISCKIHGIFSAIGFMCLLPVPLLIGIYYVNNIAAITVSVICFAVALLFFCFFVMGDKDKFKNTALSYEGIWQRLIILVCYIPIIILAVIQ